MSLWRYTCPSCGCHSFRYRSTEGPKYRCERRSCGELFDQPYDKLEGVKA